MPEVSCSVTGVIQFQLGMQKIGAALQNEIITKLVAWANMVKALAQRRVHVRTGYLQSTIYADVKGFVVIFGATAAYSSYVELGTRFMQAYPFLYPSVQDGLFDLERLLIEAINKAKAEAMNS